jgi:hypothetical protein
VSCYAAQCDTCKVGVSGDAEAVDHWVTAHVGCLVPWRAGLEVAGSARRVHACDHVVTVRALLEVLPEPAGEDLHR